MQPNDITLAVDLANSGSTTNQVYTRTEEQVNRSTYRGPDHLLHSRNILQFYRTYPTRNGNFLGAAKVSVKFTKDISVPNADGSGEVVVPLIVEASFSIPVGATNEECTALRQHLVVVLDNDTIMDALNDHLDI